jgi:hypothetical protein
MLPSRAPLLIVPIRDRRQGRRILTIRNWAISLLALAVIVLSFSIYKETRHGTAGQFGRLFATQDAVPSGAVERKVDVISEGPVPDQSASDPMLGAPAAREQVLTANSNVPATTTTIAPMPSAPPNVVAEGHGTTIVGDGKGVAIVKAPSTATAPPPVLSGGIFKGQ